MWSEKDTKLGTSALCSCIPTGMHGLTCIFWANLTPLSLKVTATFYRLGHGAGEDDTTAAIALDVKVIQTLLGIFH
jgi:hypothetical protein